MVGWHHQLNGHEFEQTLEDSEGQGSVACCSSWGCKESDTTEQLNNTTFPENRAWLRISSDFVSPRHWLPNYMKSDPKRNYSREFRKMTVPSAL